MEKIVIDPAGVIKAKRIVGTVAALAAALIVLTVLNPFVIVQP